MRLFCANARVSSFVVQVLFDDPLSQELVSARDLAREECEMYEGEFVRLQSELDGEEESQSSVMEQLKAAEEEEKLLLEKAKTLEVERNSLRKSITELQQHSQAMEQRHAAYWQEYNDLQMQLRSNERDSLRRKIQAATQQLEALNKTNVINDAFYISHRYAGFEFALSKT